MLVIFRTYLFFVTVLTCLVLWVTMIEKWGTVDNYVENPLFLGITE